MSAEARGGHPTPGEPMLSVEGIVLRFGGVQALAGVEFTIYAGEICAIIGPNGAGKTSMLNVLNGAYQPSEGVITFKGRSRRRMHPRTAAQEGMARTFQNVALFKGMSTLDNVMAGRNLKMHSNFVACLLPAGPARAEEARHRAYADEVISFLEIEGHPQRACGSPALRPAEARGARPRASRPSPTFSCSTSPWPG